MEHSKYVLVSAVSDDAIAYAGERNWHNTWWRWVPDGRLAPKLVVRYDINTEQDWPNG